MIACPNCGFENELGRIFCHQCGNKLDLNAVKPPSQGGPKIRRRRTWTPAGAARRAAEIVILLLLAWALYLACQVAEFRPAKPTNADLLAADNKRLELDQLVLRQQPASLEISETELNTMLSSLGFDKPKGTALEVVPLNFQAKLGDGVVELRLLGELRVAGGFSKKFTLNYTGTPVVLDNVFEFHPASAYVGRLPIHPMLLSTTSFIQNRFAQLVVKLSHERDQLEKLHSITVTPGKVRLDYVPPPPATTGGKTVSH